MKYVLLFVDTEEFARDLEAMGPAIPAIPTRPAPRIVVPWN
jgi:hypothetical protein